jgi:glycosyltransferase domain-containing protein
MDLTILLPTYNRPEFLRRALEYYADQDLPANIVVADSSPPETLRKNAAIADLLKSRLRIQHMSYPPDISVWDKIQHALQKVTTLSVVMAADDDFFTMGGLQRSVRYLMDHHEYSVAHGDALAFFLPDNAAVRGRIQAVVEYPQRTYDQPSGASRLISYLRSYSTIWYSVRRTAHLKECWSLIGEQGFDHYFIELIMGSLDIVSGKAKRQDGLYLARESHNARDYEMPVVWYKGDAWDRQHRLYCELVGERLAAKDGLSAQLARQCVQYALACYLHKAGYERSTPTAPDGLIVPQAEETSSPTVAPHTVAAVLPSKLADRAAEVAGRAISRVTGRNPYLPRALGPWARFSDELQPIYEVIRG